MSVRFELLGWAEPPPDRGHERHRSGPRLRLDWQQFGYAGKFVTGDTGKAVAITPRVESDALSTTGGEPVPPVAEGVVAAAAFNPDRAAPRRLRIRYITVRRDRHNEGIGARLLAFVADRAADRGYETVVISVNNPHAYVAATKAGFVYTGDDTGLAELQCERPAGGPPRGIDVAPFRAGIERFRGRSGVSVTDRYRTGPPPDPVPLPETGD